MKTPIEEPNPTPDLGASATQSSSVVDMRLCRGVVPLDPKLEPWVLELLRSPDRLHALVEQFGSPVHLHRLEPMRRNLRLLTRAAQQVGVDLDIYFARKANKCLAYLRAAAEVGSGVDIASPDELEQALVSGTPPGKIVVTAAVKPRRLLELCVQENILVVLDNADEARALAAIARAKGTSARVAIRVRSFRVEGERLHSRFGFELDDVAPFVSGWRKDADSAGLRLRSLHFHLDGYDPVDRIAALDQCLTLGDELAGLGVSLGGIDMGGGFPMSYLDQPSQWTEYWHELEQALRGKREEMTYRDQGFGLITLADRIVGDRRAYPLHRHSASDWLSFILSARRPSDPSTTLAQALRKRRLRLACEPGRAALDGCGATVARVEHLKKVAGDIHVGLRMNGSNCRSMKSELFVDPIQIPLGQRAEGVPGEPDEGYLTGTYCTESDLIIQRKLRFAGGVAQGDLFLFPNTAGYLMHFVESRSHQFPLPLNVVLEGAEFSPRLDAIDSYET